MKAEKIIRLRMQNSIFCRRIPVVQGDTARTFRFILEDITLDGTEHARIYARKPSGAEVYDECDVIGSNEVIFTPETEQIFIETGIILAEIRVAKGEKLITSYSFEFEVRQSTMRTGDIPSSDEFNALERAIEEAKGLHEPEFTEAGKRENIVSGETMQILFGKIKKWFTDLGALITKIGNKDISSIGDGTVTGAITDLDKRSTKNTSDIDVERKRIDNIAKLPEGSTAGDAELADIRVAADGTSYDTAGESVRGQINQIDQKYEKETGSLKEDLIDLEKYVEYNKVPIIWEKGSLYETTGLNNDNMSNCVRSSFIHTDRPINVEIPDGYEMIVFKYNEDKSFIEKSAIYYISSRDIKYEDAPLIRIVLRKRDNSNIDVSVAELFNFVYSDVTPILTRVSLLETKVNDPPKLNYIAFGDLHTLGRRSDDWIMQTDRAYPSVFGKYFNYDVKNFAVGGQGLTYNDTSATINLAYDDVVAHHDDIIDADLITFKWGNNDRESGNLDGCVNAYKQIFEYVKSANPYARIVVLSPNNTTSSGTIEGKYWYTSAPGKFTLTDFNNAISRLCEQYGIPYIDVNAWTQVDALTDCLGDNVHPKDDAFDKYHRYVAFCISSAMITKSATKDIDLGEFTDLTYIDKTTGQQKTDTSVMSSSDFIRIASNATIHFENVAVQNNGSICEYDVSKRFIRALVGGSWNTSFTLKTSENARYIRITAKKLDETRPSAYYVDGNDVAYSGFANSYLSEKSYPLTNVKKKPIFTVIDDDTSTLEFVQRYHDLCTSLGIKGNFAVITSHTEESEALTAKLLEYEEEGFGMLYHCYSQTNIWSWTSAFDLSACEQNYVKGKRLYKQAGFVSGDKFFIAPFGNNRQTVQDMVKRHGGEVLLSTDNNIIVGYDGATSRYNIPRCSLGHNADRYPNFTIEQLKAKINEAYDENGWIIITTHVNEWGNTMKGEERFTEVVNYALGKGMECKTFAEAYEDRKGMFYTFETM